MSAFIYFFYTSLQIIYSIIIIIINVEVAVVVIHPHHHFHSHGYSSTSLLLIRNRIVKVCTNKKKTIQNQPLLFSVVLIQPKHSVSQPAIRPAIQLKSSLSVAHSFSTIAFQCLRFPAPPSPLPFFTLASLQQNCSLLLHSLMFNEFVVVCVFILVFAILPPTFTQSSYSIFAVSASRVYVCMQLCSYFLDAAVFYYVDGTASSFFANEEFMAVDDSPVLYVKRMKSNIFCLEPFTVFGLFVSDCAFTCTGPEQVCFNVCVIQGRV